MGSTDPKRILASTVFGKEAFTDDYQIAFGRADLSRFAFTNPDFPTRSMFLTQDKFEWSIQRTVTNLKEFQLVKPTQRH